MTPDGEEWIEEIKANEPEIWEWEEFRDALVGTVERCAFQPVFCYDHEKMVGIYMRKNKCDWESATEVIDSGYAGAYMGERTPMIMHGIAVSSGSNRMSRAAI